MKQVLHAVILAGSVAGSTLLAQQPAPPGRQPGLPQGGPPPAGEQGARLNALTTWAQAKAVLTPEQRGRVQGWADARRERARGFRAWRGRRPGGAGAGGEPGPGRFGGRRTRMM